MTPIERVRADYAGTSLTIGPHPLALCRGELALRGVQRAIDLRGRPIGPARAGRGRGHHAAAPGTAKGFVFLTLEDETGIANVIVSPISSPTYGRRSSGSRICWSKARCRFRMA